MNNYYIKKLEFDKIVKILEGFAITSFGKEIALNLLPSFNKSTVLENLLETNEATVLILRNGNLPIVPINEVDYYFKVLNNEGTLSISQLLSLGKFLRLSKEIKAYYTNMDIDLSSPKLEAYFNNLYFDFEIEKAVFNCILDEYTLNDTSSSTLFNIRKNIKKCELDIKNKLNSYMSSKYIQEPIITIRNNRYVIPVKQEYRTNIPGFIHDISSTGATIFIEPMPIFELNNNLNTLKIEEMAEIEIILANLCSMFHSILPELENNLRIISKLDFIFAKAKYAINTNATEPIINDTKYINLINARHPLINSTKVVPINVSLGDEFSTLVITGPNTGGKTVTIKTIGLLCVMALSGLYIPTDEGSNISILNNIFVDIGDEQSITESLSTFSSHLSNIINIINTADSKSLILLDELGAGTDPIEGESLAISILEHLHSINALTVATTHYSEVKNYALVTNGFKNASSEFDVNTLQPTYRLLMGVPGKSNAFAIAKRLGLPSDIINKAESLISKPCVNIEDLLKRIYDDKIIIENEKQKVLEQSKRIEQLKKEFEMKFNNLNNQEKELIENAKLEARNILLETKDLANSIIRDLNAATSTKEANIIRNNLNKSLEGTKSKNEIANPTPLTIDNLKIGTSIFVNSIKQNGTVLSLPDKNNKVKIEIGSVKSYFSIEDLSISTNKKIENTIKPKNNIISKSSTIFSEINVIGFNVEEACFAIDKYLDDCVLANLPTIRIVHGKGTGKLKEGIHSFLRKHPQVKSFRIGTFGEGEMGVTIVELK